MPLIKKSGLQDPTEKKKHSKPKDKDARRDHNYSLIPRKEDTTDRDKLNKNYNESMYVPTTSDTSCYLVESSSDTKLRKIQNKLRSGGVTRSETLIDTVAKCYSLHAPIEDKPCGDEAGDTKDNDCDIILRNQRKEFRSVSPCFTDPNSTALVNGSPQSSNIAFDSLDINADILVVDELEDPLLAGWDDDLFLYRSTTDDKGRDILPIDGFANLSCSGDADNEDKFSSCYDDSDSEVDVEFCGSQCRSKEEMKSYKTKEEILDGFGRPRECEVRRRRSTSAPVVRLSNQQRPATPWPATQAGEELLMNKERENKAKIMKTFLVSRELLWNLDRDPAKETERLLLRDFDRDFNFPTDRERLVLRDFDFDRDFNFVIDRERLLLRDFDFDRDFNFVIDRERLLLRDFDFDRDFNFLTDRDRLLLERDFELDLDLEIDREGE
uniref:Uncharacterized protein n=1 Tax=Strigamia maritima TaxID=126957 RepID=T1JE51_STRMM